MQQGHIACGLLFCEGIRVSLLLAPVTARSESRRRSGAEAEFEAKLTANPSIIVTRHAGKGRMSSSSTSAALSMLFVAWKLTQTMRSPLRTPCCLEKSPFFALAKLSVCFLDRFCLKLGKAHHVFPGCQALLKSQPNPSSQMPEPEQPNLGWTKIRDLLAC